MREKLTRVELLDLVSSRVGRTMLARPLFDTPEALAKRVKDAVLGLFGEHHKRGRFLRQGYVPAFDVRVSDRPSADPDVWVHFKDEDMDFLFSEPKNPIQIIEG